MADGKTIVLANGIAEHLSNLGFQPQLGGWMTVTQVGDTLDIGVCEEPEVEGDTVPVDRFIIQIEKREKVPA